MVFKVLFAYPASFSIVCLLLISEKLLIVRLYIYIYIFCFFDKVSELCHFASVSCVNVKSITEVCSCHLFMKITGIGAAKGRTSILAC